MNDRAVDLRADLVERMMQAADQLYVPHVHRVFRDEGVSALRQLLGTVRTLYRHVPCECFTEGLMLSIPLGGNDSIAEAGESALIGYAQLAQAQLSQASLIIEKDGQLRIYADARDISQQAATGIVYHYRYSQNTESKIERVLFGNEMMDIIDLSGFPSAFAVPTFADLNAALDHYEAIIESPDPYLQQVWRDSNRLAFAPKPEKYMRRSLEHYLRQCLRDAIVRPEQNVNETEPVDIEINWSYQNRLAWIEIKWLGHSAPVGAAEWSTTYTESRAVSGAKQLADYLTAGAARTLSTPCKGYLVVFDGRRKALGAADEEIDSERGHHYRFRDISYPAEIINRPDMMSPIRFFLAPIGAPVRRSR